MQNNYPGIRTAITEYNWGGLEDINGALAARGRARDFLATMWGPPDADQPGSFAFRVYRNYDGMGGSFGETSVKAESEDSDKISVLRPREASGH